jgi:hypothetical protein
VITYAETITALLAKYRSDPDARRIVALAWIKVAVRDDTNPAGADGMIADVRAVLEALEQA